MSDVVLDASVILAAILREPGGERLGALTDHLLISAVNYAEVGSRLSDLGFENSFLPNAASSLGLEVVPFDVSSAGDAVALRPLTRQRGLSLGDRACLALAMSRSAVALTADRAWHGIDLPVEIELVR